MRQYVGAVADLVQRARPVRDAEYRRVPYGSLKGRRESPRVHDEVGPVVVAERPRRQEAT